MFRPQYKLQKVSSQAGGKGYRAILNRRASYGTDQIMEEAVREMGLRISPDTLKMYVCGVLDSIVNNTMNDGCTRILDGYLRFRLDVSGRFDDADSAWDDEKNALRLNVAPLKKLRAKCGLKPKNVQKQPYVSVTDVRSEGVDTPNTVQLGRRVLVTGKNLRLANAASDFLHFFCYDRNNGITSVVISQGDLLENEADHLLLDLGDKFDGKYYTPYLNLRIYSSGGKEGGNMRLYNYPHDIHVLARE